MAKQTINLGTAPGGADGDTIRTGFDKANSNFTEIYDKNSAQDTTLSAVQTTANSALTKANAAVPVNYNGDFASDVAILSVRVVGDATDPFRQHAPANFTVVYAIPSNNLGAGLCIATQFGGSQQFFMRSRNAGLTGDPNQRWKPWVELWHTANTIVDANNFIKRA